MEIDKLKKRKEVKAESPIEKILLREFHLHEIYPEVQYQIGCYRADFAFPQYMVVVECDGKEWHSTDEQVERDRIRDEYMKKLGWTVIRISGSEIYKQADEIANQFKGRKARYNHPRLELLEIDEFMDDDAIAEIHELNKIKKQIYLEEREEFVRNYNLNHIIEHISDRYKNITAP